jgi:hypothetical protein
LDKIPLTKKYLYAGWCEPANVTTNGNANLYAEWEAAEIIECHIVSKFTKRVYHHGPALALP